MYLCSGRTDGGGIGWIDRKYFCGEGTTNKETEGIELIQYITLDETKLNVIKLVQNSLYESKAHQTRLDQTALK